MRLNEMLKRYIETWQIMPALRAPLDDDLLKLFAMFETTSGSVRIHFSIAEMG
jgi:hypothetical protein